MAMGETDHDLLDKEELNIGEAIGKFSGYLI